MVSIYVFIICILNLLITTLGEAYSDFQASAREHFLQERASTAADYLFRNIRWRFLPSCGHLSSKRRMSLAVMFLCCFSLFFVIIVLLGLPTSLGGIIVLLAQLFAGVLTQPDLDQGCGRRYLWICYDRDLDGNVEAILDAACGQHRGDWQQDHKTENNKVPQINVGTRQEAQKLVLQIENVGVVQQGKWLPYTGIRIDADLMRQELAKAIDANASKKPRMSVVIQEGRHGGTALSAFDECDDDGNGVLTWNNGEVRAYVHKVFNLFDLVPMDDITLHRAFLLIDREKLTILDPLKALILIDVIFRVIFYVSQGTGRRHTIHGV
jgi:hypothetical protein